MTDAALAAAAEQARSFSKAPYSGFTVGAALLCADGTVYTGCNIENPSFGATVCAERVALFKALSEGHDTFVRLAVAGGKVGQASAFCPPCGICRQVLAAWCPREMPVLITGEDGTLRRESVGSLLPLAFDDSSVN